MRSAIWPRFTPLVLAVAVLIVPALGSGAGPVKGPRRCGTVLGNTLTVKGPITCKRARTFARCMLTRRCRGVFHGSPSGPRSQWYTTFPGGWRCGATFQGVTSCRHGKGQLTLQAL